jgi:hypothetical protein
MKIKQTFRKLQVVLAAAMVVFATAVVLSPNVAFAGSLTRSSVILYNMDSSGTSQFAIAFKTASAGATSVTIDFQSAWTSAGGAIGASGSQTVSNGNCTSVTGASAGLPTGSSLSASSSGTVITVSGVSALSANTTYCTILTFGSAVTNPTSTGFYSVVLTAGSDSATDSVDIVTNDQLVLSATVPPSFTMALNANVDSFTSNLSPTATVGTTGITATFNTNASTGWYMWGVDSNTGLRSPSQSYTIASTTPGTNASLSNGSDGFVSSIPAGGITQGTGAGTTSATAPYASSGAGNGSGLDSTERMMASSTGTANGAIVTVKEYSTISPITPAGTDYTDTVTLVGAGAF